MITHDGNQGGGALTTRALVEWIRNDDSPCYVIKGSGFVLPRRQTLLFEHFLAAHYGSFEHGWLLARGILSTLEITLPQVTVDEDGQMALIIHRNLVKSAQDHEHFKTLTNHPQRNDLISDIAASILFSANWVFEWKRPIVFGTASHAGSTQEKEPICLLPEQASFVATKVFSKIQDDRQSVFDPLWPDTERDKWSKFGWRTSKIDVKADYVDQSPNKFRSLCHFPAFFCSPDAPIVSAISNDGRESDIGVFGPLPDAERHAKMLEDSAFKLYLTKGVLPYVKGHIDLNKREKRNGQTLTIWLGIAPEYQGHGRDLKERQSLYATFWTIRVLNASFEETKRIAAEIRLQISDVQCQMLRAFSTEINQELTFERDQLRQAKLELENTNRVLLRRDQEYRQVRNRLNVLLKATGDAQAAARLISKIVDPGSALMTQQPQIADCFDETKWFACPGQRDIKAEHNVGLLDLVPAQCILAHVIARTQGQATIQGSSAEEFLNYEIKQVQHELEKNVSDRSRRSCHFIVRPLLPNRFLLVEGAVDVVSFISALRNNNKNLAFLQEVLASVKRRFLTNFKRPEDYSDPADKALTLGDLLAFMPPELECREQPPIEQVQNIPFVLHVDGSPFSSFAHLRFALAGILDAHLSDNANNANPSAIKWHYEESTKARTIRFRSDQIIWDNTVSQRTKELASHLMSPDSEFIDARVQGNLKRHLQELALQGGPAIGEKNGLSYLWGNAELLLSGNDMEFKYNCGQ